MINEKFIKLVFSGANIQRWNDHIRPSIGFTELDKQAHKMIIAYLLAKMEEQHTKIDWIKLIEGSIFEMLQRFIITDIKPPIFYKIVKSHGKELNEWVLTELKMSAGLMNNDFFEKFREHFETSTPSLEKKILNAAHYLATNWEYKIIYEMNKNLYGAEETKKAILSEIENHYELISVKEFVTIREKLRNFVDLVGQLRYQKRWSHTPRVPETTVLGHMYIVAVLSYISLYDKKVCNKLKRNTFLGGLFHDLPEVLTRDIISPVKKSVKGLENIIKRIEKEQIEEELLPLLPSFMHDEIRYFVYDEFSCKIIKKNEPKIVSSTELYKDYNDDIYEPLDGKILKESDIVAAYFEASISIENGIKPTNLVKSKADMEEQYPFIKELLQH